jgi:hypothetical protein
MIKKKLLVVIGITFFLFSSVPLSIFGSKPPATCWLCSNNRCTSTDWGEQGQQNCAEDWWNGTVTCGTSGPGCMWI